jgi:hypothetical protein
MNLPPRVQDLLDSCPRAGNGVHLWLFSVALHLHRHMSDGEIFALLKARTQTCGRFVPDHEIWCAIRNSAGGTWSPRSYPNDARPRPSFEPKALAKVVARLPEASPEYLARRSPIDPCERSIEDFLRHVFRPGESVIIFKNYYSQGELLWRYPIKPDLEQSEKLCAFERGCPKGVWFLATPVDGQYHLNPRQDCQSRRSEESVTSYRHMVLESDVADESDWITYLCQITLPIVAIYSTGGRAPHALIDTGARSKDEWDKIKYRIRWNVVRYGACEGSLSAVRLTRLPGCRREERNAWQRLYYLNPDPARKRICEMEVLR